jgi:hypothetical protein
MAAEVRQLFKKTRGLTDAARQAPRLLLLPPALDSAISKFLEGNEAFHSFQFTSVLP